MLIYDAVHNNAIMSQQCSTISASDSFTIMALYKFTYLLTYKSVLHGCIVRMYSCAYGTFTAEAEIVRSATGSKEYGKPTLNLRVALSASSN